jgi:hypothetical protein
MTARNFHRKIVAAATLWVTSLPAASFAATDAVLPARNLSPWGMFVNADVVVQAVMVGLAFASLAAILRPARTPKGTEVCTVVKHVTKRLRQHWPHTRVVWRGDSHYGRVEAMEWAEDNDADYIFGLPGNTLLDAMVVKTASSCRRVARRARCSAPSRSAYAVSAVSCGALRPDEPPMKADQPQTRCAVSGLAPISRSMRWRAPPRWRCKNAPRRA